MLEGVLVVDSVTTNSFNCHFEVSNVGKTKAKKILTALSTPHMTSADLAWRQEPNEIVPSGRLLIQRSGLNGIRRSTDDFYSFKLLVTYESETSLGRRKFWSEFQCNLSDGGLAVGQYHASSVHSGEGELRPEEVLNRVGFNATGDPDSGGLTAWIRIADLQQPALIARSSGNLIVYDPALRQFVFSRCSSGLVSSAVYSLLDDTNDWQFVAMTWSNDYCAAFVNTNQVILPNRKTVEDFRAIPNTPRSER